MLGKIGALTVGSPKVGAQILGLTGKMAGRIPEIPAAVTSAMSDATQTGAGAFQSLAEKAPGKAESNLEKLLGLRDAKKAEEAAKLAKKAATGARRRDRGKE